MTPLAIEIALHYNCGASDYRNGDFSASAVREVIDGFLRGGLLKADVTGDITEVGAPQYRATEGLRMYVRELTEVPCPIQKWVMP
ncbi:MAG: hypothetical protein KGL39_59885 [Patescibacteria group bacterium]|nr:hypothetical protein [Patescibacteria group bacterium]